MTARHFTVNAGNRFQSAFNSAHPIPCRTAEDVWFGVVPNHRKRLPTKGVANVLRRWSPCTQRGIAVGLFTEGQSKASFDCLAKAGVGLARQATSSSYLLCQYN